MGYVIALVLGAGVLALFIVALVRAAAGRSRGHLPPERGPTMVETPAADAPTPGASGTAPPAQVEGAQTRTPPA